MSLSLSLSLSLLLSFTVVIRRAAVELAVQQMLWKIDYEDIGRSVKRAASTMSKVIRKIGNETWKSICNYHHFTTLKWHLMRIQGSMNVDTLLFHRLPMLALLHQDNIMPYKLFPHYWPLGRGIPSVSRGKSHRFGAFFVVDMAGDLGPFSVPCSE